MGNDIEGPGSNRLSDERSPYLRQHAHNPVDWYPWGSEALERARAEDRPILLSIGYSACHWCHVMERESFDDVTTAAQMNRDFVNIKVDREERPDLDSIYMAAVQSLTGRGGWPMTVFLTPEGEPFYGGTYFPPEARPGMPAFRQVLTAVAEAWRDRRPQVLEGAERIRETLEAGAGGEGRAGSASTELSPELLEGAVQVLRSRFDPAQGGFGAAPKFPQPVTLEFLLGRWAAGGDAEALRMVTTTLKRMAAGGMRDHLGGGFHRYSVDARWLVPHFEKMLYDNALLARVYLDGYRATGDSELLSVAHSTLDYMRSDLLAPEGGFWSARDADSEGEEGLFYLWSPQQVAGVAAAEGLDEETVSLFCRLYDIKPGGNFPEGPGGAIPWLGTHAESVAAEEDAPLDALLARVGPLRSALLGVREQREPPFLDTKILCVWSALAVEAFAESAMVGGEGAMAGGVGDGRAERDLQVAVRGARFLLDEMRVQGRLFRVFSHGEPRIPGFLEDHAALGNALLTLHEATLDPGWLPDVRWCAEEILSRFFDAASGILWDAPSDGEKLVVRPRDLHDGATPSGNALAVELLLRAGHLFDEPEWRSIAQRALAAESERMTRYPSAFGRLLRQVERARAPSVEVAVLGPDGPDREALRDAARAGLHPNRTVTGGDPAQQALSGYPLLRDRGDAAGEPQAYLCRDYVCDAPTTSPDELRQNLMTGG